MNGWHSAAAADTLARTLYVTRCQFYGVTVLPWDRVPSHIRAGLLELAIRTLTSLAPVPADQADQTDPLWAVADDLARLDQRRATVIATINPEHPWGIRP
jgi:hypothetical protein